MVLPILRGPGRGFRWIVGSYNHGCWLGTYEYEKQVVVPRLVKPGDVVYDLGAHVGFFTLIFSRLVGPGGAVYSFEPFPENYRYLIRHLALNRITNVVPIQAGVGAETGQAFFHLSGHSSKVVRHDASGVMCRVHNLIDYISSHHARAPTLIKMDIEGEEARVVPSILSYVAERRVDLLISTHGDQITAALGRLLLSRGYRVTALQHAERPDARGIDNATLILAEA
jgi:FkbM family methyltransferase